MTEDDRKTYERDIERAERDVAAAEQDLNRAIAQGTFTGSAEEQLKRARSELTQAHWRKNTNYWAG
ncbi:MAG: hypothetical protein JNK90_20960 [Planctomycetaceae bacterium]|nr:hypothetical protein [Planctomycetaceae bacterium]